MNCRRRHRPKGYRFPLVARGRLSWLIPRQPLLRNPSARGGPALLRDTLGGWHLRPACGGCFHLGEALAEAIGHDFRIVDRLRRRGHRDEELAVVRRDREEQRKPVGQWCDDREE